MKLIKLFESLEMIMVNSRNKGAAFERFIVNKIMITLNQRI